MTGRSRLTIKAMLCACVFGVGIATAQTPPVKKEVTVTKEKTRDGVTTSRTVQKSTDIVGRPITSNNQNIGRVEDLVVDANSGRVVYGVGSMTDASGRLYAIPWPAGKYSAATQTYSVDIDPARMQASPSFTQTEYPNFSDDEFAVRTFKTYDQTPYWKAERTTVVKASDTGHPASTYTQRWTAAPTTTYRVSELRGRNIVSTDGTALGQINEVVLDPDNGRVMYVVTTRDGKSTPIPWTALRARDRDFELTITADRWREAPIIETENWTTVSEPAYTQRVYRYYEVEGDWKHDDDDDDDKHGGHDHKHGDHDNDD